MFSSHSPNFKIQENPIGHGSFATVYCAHVIRPYPPLKIGDRVALKAIHTSRNELQQDQEKLANEVALMKSLDHPNIVKLYGVDRVGNRTALVMEYCVGDLNRYRRSHGGTLSEERIRGFVGQIGEGLKYLHCHEIVHRDLKPHNILLAGTPDRPILKIADFGFARFLRSSDLADTVCGSPIYMAPEIQFHSQYSAKVDLWSLGVIVYELVTGVTPFTAVKTPFELSQELRARGSQPFALPEGANASQELRDLVSGLLTIDQERRFDLAQFSSHPFVGLPRTSSEESSEVVAGGQRDRRFSFLVAEASVDDQKAESLLSDARESTEIIIAHLTVSQPMSDFLVFEILTVASEFLADFLAEYRSNAQSINVQLQNAVIEAMGIYAREAWEYAQMGRVEGGIGAFQFLFDKGMEYARAGARAEKVGDDFAVVKYQRALAMLSPIAYSKSDDHFTVTVRELFVQISKRHEALHRHAGGYFRQHYHGSQTYRSLH
jgi:serine/threonine protein kinase